MLARIPDNHFIYLEQVTQGSEECLVKWFSVRDPRAYYIESAWDGWYRRYNVRLARLALPFLPELIQCCEQNNIPLEIQDERPAPQYPAPQEEQITESLIDNMTLEPYQVRGLRACCRNEIGIVSAKTGAGKTIIMCGLVKMFRCPTLIVTEQIVVLNQIVDTLTLTGVVYDNDIGMFCHGFMPDKNLVIVGSIQSISTPSKPRREEVRVTLKSALKQAQKWLEREDEQLYRVFPRTLVEALLENPAGLRSVQGKYLQLLMDACRELEWQRRQKWYQTRLARAGEIQQLITKCDLLLVDECDTATSNMHAPLFKKYFRGRRKFGFSGTPYDSQKPVQALLLKENLGNVIFEAQREEVEAQGRIIPIRFYMLCIGPDDRRDSRAYDIAMKEEMVDNPKFHELVASIPKGLSQDGTLILVDTSPIEPLGYALEELIPGSKFIYGKTPQKERKKYINLFEQRGMNCLIGGKILKRGFDLKGGVENLVIIGGGAKWSEFEQMVGRALRVNRRGWANVFGFFFLNNRYLYKHSKEHLKAVLNMGYTAKVICGNAEIDGQAFVRSKFRIKTS